MRPRSRLGGVRYQLRWKLRVLRSNLEAIALDVKDWFAFRWGTPEVKWAEPFGAPIQGGRGQRLEITVAEAHPGRVATVFLAAVEYIALEERKAARRILA